jgi:hypothetical protein
LNTTIKRLSKFHNNFVKLIDEVNSDEAKASLYEALCTINWKIHSGIYYCEKIEIGLINLGERNKISSNDSSYKKRGVLHVGTEFHETGGHTRLFENYLKVFDSFENHLFLTKQNKEDIPTRIIKNSKIKKIYTSRFTEKIIDKAIELSTIWRSYDYVILHIHPNDVIPNIAYGMFKHNNILFINHADHVFWIGKKIFKNCVNIRPLGLQISKDLRSINNNILAPIILDITDANFIKPFRSYLSNKITFGSMTSVYKIIPDENKNFIQDIYFLLEKFPNSIFKLIGVEEKDLIKFGYDKNYNPRLMLFGQIEHPKEILETIDIYLEGYPYNSLTALFDAVVCGACPVLMYDVKNQNCNLESDLSFKGILYHSSDRINYFNHIETLFKSKELRIKIVGKIQDRMSRLNTVEYAKKVIFSSSSNLKMNETNYDFSNISNETFQFDRNLAISNNWQILVFNSIDLKIVGLLTFFEKIKLSKIFFGVNDFSKYMILLRQSIKILY